MGWRKSVLTERRFSHVWKEHIENGAVIVGSLCVLVLSIYAVKGVYPFGSGIIIWGDMALQGVPWLYQAYDILTGAISPDFTWRFSGGVETSSLLVSLFNFPVIFSERENIYLFASVILLYKMICMGLSMYFFSCRFAVPRGYRILAGILYATCSCVLIYYQIGYVMLDIAILFPVLMRGFYALMEDGKPFLYVGMLALCMSRSVYVTFMVCMYLFPMSLFFFWFRVERTEVPAKCRNLVVATLLALGLSTLFWLPDMAAILGSNRAAAETVEGSLWMKYLHAIQDEKLYSGSSVGLKACFLMGCSLSLAALRNSWSRMTGGLRYHKAQFLFLLWAVFIPGTEVLWHGGSHAVWIVRFAFLISFVMIEILLVLRQHRLVDFSGECLPLSAERGKELPAFLCLLSISVLALWLCRTAEESWGALFVNTLVCLLLWYLFYHLVLQKAFPRRRLLLVAVLVVEIAVNGLTWIAPNFCPSFHANQYIFPAVKLSQEIDFRLISPLDRTRDIYSSFHSNYASITGTNSIGNFLGSIPPRLQQQYADLGYGTVWVRITDCGGTLFSDALLHVTSVFTEKERMDPEFYQEIPSIQAMQWYQCRYLFPIGIEIQQDAAPNSHVFDFQNRIFQSVTGLREDLMQEVPVRLQSSGQNEQSMDIEISGRKRLYFYGDFTYYEDAKIIEGIYLNGELRQIPDRADVQGTSYPSEDNNRVLDFGTFENETVHLKIKWLEQQDASKLHIGLMDLGRLSEAADILSKRDAASDIAVGKDSLSLRYRSEHGGLLFLPMNFYDAWKCEVNGHPVKLQSVFGGFVGVPMDEGENEIRLQYDRGYPSIAWCLTGCSLLLGTILVRFFRRGRTAQSCRLLDLPVTACYGMLALMLFVSVYLVPALMLVKVVLG